MKIRSLLLALAVSGSLVTNLCPASIPSWTQTAAPAANWNALASSADGNVLVAAIGGGVTPGALYVSTNAGVSWTLTDAPDAVWMSVAASADGSQLFAAAGGSFAFGGIYSSTNYGGTWTATSAPVTNWSAIACSVDGSKLVATSGGNCASGPIYTSDDSGATWTVTGAPVISWWSVASSADGTRLVAGSVSGGIYLSMDSGATWSYTKPSSGWWWENVIISADGQKLVVASEDGLVYASSDSGATWNLIKTVAGSIDIAGSTNVARLVTAGVGPVSDSSGIYLSTDTGATWVTNQWPYAFCGDIIQPHFASSSDGTRLAVTLGYDGIYTWQAPPPSAPDAITRPATGTNGDFALHGEVDPGRLETSAWFEWDTSLAFGNGTGPIFAGNDWNNVSLSTVLSGFPPGVAVYFRIAAINEFGFSIGQPRIYQAPLVTPLGDNPFYLICGDSYTDPGATVSALPVAIAGGEFYSLALRADRTVLSWGNTVVGLTNAPIIPPPISNAVAIAAGNLHALALKEDGTVVAWGDNIYGETDIPTNLDCAVAIAAGYGFSLALKPDGTVVGWGLGTNNAPADYLPDFGQAQAPDGLSNVVAIAAGYDTSLALKSDGTVMAWGNAAYGGTALPAGLSNVVAIAAGNSFGLALKNDGQVVGWGNPVVGQPIPPDDLTNVVAIAAGFYHRLALKADGTVVGWGQPPFGQISPPAGLSNVVAIAAGAYHGLALKADGSVVGWGKDPFGETVAPTNLVGSLGTVAGTGEVYNGTPGTYPRTFTATNAQGVTGQAARTVVVLGLQESRQHVLAEMAALKAKQPRRHFHALNGPMAALNRTMATNLWVSDMYLAIKTGQRVFAEDINILRTLNRLMGQKDGDLSGTMLQGWEAGLVKADRLAAEMAIGRAYYFGVSQKQLARAMVLFTLGDQAAAKNQRIAAVVYYAGAWKQAAYLLGRIPTRPSWPPF